MMPVTPSLPQLSPLSWLLAYFCRAALVVQSMGIEYAIATLMGLIWRLLIEHGLQLLGGQKLMLSSLKQSNWKHYRFLKSSLRSGLVTSFSLFLRWILCRPITSSQKSAMVFAPHQDDETLGCGGMIAFKREQKVPVWVVFLADGQGSHRNHPRIKPKELIQIRKQEAVTALTTLGVELSEIHFLDQPDGSLSNLSEDERQHTLERLVQLLRTLKPQEVYVPYRKDGQSDHEAAYALAQAAIVESKLEVELLQYPIWAMWYPWRFEIKSPELANAYRLPLNQVWDKKRRALEAYRSQYLPLDSESESSLPPNFLKLFLSSDEIFFKGRE